MGSPHTAPGFPGDSGGGSPMNALSWLQTEVLWQIQWAGNCHVFLLGGASIVLNATCVSGFRPECLTGVFGYHVLCCFVQYNRLECCVSSGSLCLCAYVLGHARASATSARSTCWTSAISPHFGSWTATTMAWCPLRLVCVCVSHSGAWQLFP